MTIMQRFFAELVKGNSLDTAVRTATNGRFWTFSDLKSGMIADMTAHQGNVFLTDYCKIDLTNEDTGSVDGLDAGGTISKDSNTVVPNLVSSLDTVPVPTSSTVFGGIQFNWPTATTEKEKFILKAMSASWIPAAIERIKEVYGLDGEKGSVKTVDIVLANLGGGSNPARSVMYSDDSGAFVHAEVYLDTGNTYDMSTVDGTIYKNGKFWNNPDMSVCHEMVHVLMASLIKDYMKLPVVVHEALADLSIGIDHEWTSTISRYASLPTTVKKLINITGMSTTELGIYPAGYMMLRYMMAQSPAEGFVYDNRNRTSVTITGDYAEDSTLLSTVGTVNARESMGTFSITGNNISETYRLENGKKTIHAAGGNDVVYVYSGNHVVNGDDGIDKIYISGGAPTVNGGNGNDTITVTSGGVLHGDSGNDTFNLNNGTTTVYGDAGQDIINVKAGKHTVYGGASNDKFSITQGEGTYYGEAGNDVYDVTGGTVTVNGGIGNDSFTLGNAKATVIGDAGNDRVTMTAGTHTVNTGAGMDNIYIKGGTQDVKTGADVDTVRIYNGSGTVFAEAGRDKLYINGGSVKVYSGNDNDEFNTVAGGTGLLDGGAGADTFYITAGSNTIYGQAGNDSFTVKGGSSTIYSGNDKDRFTVSGGTGKLYGQAGSDTFTISGGSNVIYGGDDKDTLNVNGGTGAVYGDAGNDMITITKGSAKVYGGDGVDTIKVENGSTVVSAGAGNDIITITNASGGSVSGDAGNDAFTVNAGKISLFGNAGNDTFKVTGGTSLKINGGDGTDSIDLRWGKVANLIVEGVEAMTINQKYGTFNISKSNGFAVFSNASGTFKVNSGVLNFTDKKNVSVASLLK